MKIEFNRDKNIEGNLNCNEVGYKKKFNKKRKKFQWIESLIKGWFIQEEEKGWSLQIRWRNWIIQLNENLNNNICIDYERFRDITK